MNSVKVLRFSIHVRNAFEHGYLSSRHFSLSTSRTKAYISNVTIIGAGHMGTGIAQNAALVGNNVIVADVSQSSLDRSRKKIEDRLLKLSSRKRKGKSEDDRKAVDSVLSQIQWTTNMTNAVSNSDLVIEAIPERKELKHKLFAEIDQAAQKEAIFTTNTSSLPVHEVAQSLSSERKSRFGGTHFFDRDVKLVEVIRIQETSNATYHKIKEWTSFIGKTSVTCKDTPGFIVNRLNIPYFINALKMYERGDADFKDIDLAMKFGAGYPFGPFELADHIGLDVLYDILQGWSQRFPNESSYSCPEILCRLYAEGKYGRKVGEGFYKYK